MPSVSGLARPVDSAADGATRQLADFVCRLRFQDVPEPVLAAARLTLLDAIACGLAGIVDVPAASVADLVAENGGVAEATLWGRGLKVPAAEAALVLGAAIHAHGLDDVHTKLHVASVVIPAAIAVGERVHVSGRGLLTAIVAGYETMVRIGRAANTTRSFMLGWRPTSTCGTFGAAAAASSLFSLSSAQTAGALGLAGNRSSGLFTPPAQGSVSLRLDPGLAAQSGVLAACLAARGVLGSDTVLEARHGGFLGLISDVGDPAAVTSELGRAYALPSANRKLDPVPMSLLSAVEAARKLHARLAGRPEPITHITLRTSSPVIRECGARVPVAGPLASRQLQAQLSAAYVVPSVLLDGAFTLDHLKAERLDNPAVRALGEVVELVLDPELDAGYPAALSNTVEVRLGDGTTLREAVLHPPGSPAHPLDFRDIAEKYRNLALAGGRSHSADDVIEMVASLEQVGDVRELTDLLA